MKITKQYLKQVIKEELQRLSEAEMIKVSPKAEELFIQEGITSIDIQAYGDKITRALNLAPNTSIQLSPTPDGRGIRILIPNPIDDGSFESVKTFNSVNEFLIFIES